MADDSDDGHDNTEGRGKVVRLPSKLNAGAIRPRRDGFTPAKQRTFFEALRETGCIRDACRVARISPRQPLPSWPRVPEGALPQAASASTAAASARGFGSAWPRAWAMRAGAAREARPERAAARQSRTAPVVPGRTG
jgi:hypothetical protein